MNYSFGAGDITELVLKFLQINCKKLYYQPKLSFHIWHLNI